MNSYASLVRMTLAQVQGAQWQNDVSRMLVRCNLYDYTANLSHEAASFALHSTKNKGIST